MRVGINSRDSSVSSMEQDENGIASEKGYYVYVQQSNAVIILYNCERDEGEKKDGENEWGPGRKGSSGSITDMVVLVVCQQNQ